MAEPFWHRRFMDVHDFTLPISDNSDRWVGGRFSQEDRVKKPEFSL